MGASGQKEERLLWWDEDKEEPYLLIPGFPDLRITPFRKEDDPHLVELYNDPLIGSWAWRRPYPYLLADRDFVWNVLYPPQQAAMALLKPLLTLPSDPRGAEQAMLKAVITGWCVWVGMDTLIAHVETRNTGSQSVVRRCGFTLVDLEQREWPADKGGGMRELGLWVLDLKRVGSGSEA
ncbi:hypothetical protein EHS25_005290 [Saitozyma podzolica]|uniref:N-acetyltransferase domain-containing protein n=1 Tax=Saitozyma podzolica TaxID=1890683 RepID=A0A427XZA7_9TREE|nr:hypothetical protein EHS25_005290 [Saitozyma podzolica]